MFKTTRSGQLHARRAAAAVIAFTTLAAFSDCAFALERTSASSLRCNGAMDAIRRDGAIIVRRPSERVSGLTVYDRYVSGAASCNADEIAVLQDIKTVDAPICAFFICKHAPMGNY